MTFDNTDELVKVKAVYPAAKLVLRVLADDSKSVCRLGTKFGCPPEDTYQLLQAARDLDLNVIGVSFHVGSGCTDASAFEDAVHRARRVFDEGEALGFQFDLLDIGGGFPGSFAPATLGTDASPQAANSVAVSFTDIANSVNSALDRHFPAGGDLRIIAEPGRYYVSSACTLACNIIARRTMADRETGDVGFMYYINDGCYGSFNCLIYDHAVVAGMPLRKPAVSAKVHKSSVWGPTCDSMDCIQATAYIHEMQVGDWIFYEDMGAYTMCAASCFNGMPLADQVYAYSGYAQEDLVGFI